MTTNSAANDLQSERTEMRRDVTLFGGISVLAGIMIGSGILERHGTVSCHRFVFIFFKQTV